MDYAPTEFNKAFERFGNVAPNPVGVELLVAAVGRRHSDRCTMTSRLRIRIRSQPGCGNWMGAVVKFERVCPGNIERLPMRLDPLRLLSIAFLAMATLPATPGQTALPAYRVLGGLGGLSADQIARNKRMQAILADGWKTTPADAEEMEAKLARDPEDLHPRIRLISYYSQHILSGPRLRHIFWLIENHPDADAFRDADIVMRIGANRDEADYARAKALWQQQATRFPKSAKVLSNAAMALAEDPEIALQMIRAARSAEPRNSEWTTWLAISYADAIRWTFWDGRSMMTSVRAPEEHGRYPVQLPAVMRQRVKDELEASADVALVRATGEALLRQAHLLRMNSVAGFSEVLTPELPMVVEYGEMLLARARQIE